MSLVCIKITAEDEKWERVNKTNNFIVVFLGHAETAHNRIASVVLGFKEALLEEAEKKKDKRKYVNFMHSRK